MIRNPVVAALGVAVASLLASPPSWAGTADGAAAGAPAAAPAAGAQPPPKPKPPSKYEILRFREDWRPLLGTPVCERCDPSDRLKAMRIGPCVWVDLGGQARLRGEWWSGLGFGAADPESDGWGLLRLLAYADLHVDPYLRFFVQGIYADSDGRDAGPRPVDQNHGDLLDAFAEAHTAPGRPCGGGLRIGREEYVYGKHRLIGPLDWTNVRRTFDGVHGWVESPSWRWDGWWSRPVLVAADEWDEWYLEGTEFDGVYGRFKGWKGGSVEPYALYLHRDAATWLGVTGEEDRGTVGCLVSGPLAGSKCFDFEAEGGVQFGEFAGDPVLAGFFAGEVGWKPGWKCLDPRFALGFDWASGDGDGPGGDLGTFNQLFPTGHMYFGWIDLIGRQNLVAGRATVVVTLLPKVTCRVDLHTFWRATTEDAVYNAAGGVTRAPLGSEERHTGEELDVQVKWSPNRHWDLEVGYGHFFAGPFLEDTGPHEDVDFLYASATVTF